MKVLLIGGTGILSTDTARCALDGGMEVYCLNRGKRGYLLPEGARVLVADVRNRQEVEKQTAGLFFDVVVDFLSYTTGQLAQSLSLFLDKCTQYIFISSAAAYHKNSEDDIITEDFPLGDTSWSYGNNKAACEKLIADTCEKFQHRYTIVRPYVTYGDTRIPFGVISNGNYWSLANRILVGKPVVLWDGGSAVCTLTHTSDFAVGLVGLFLNPAVDGEAFHITSDERLTWKEVLEEIEQALETKAIVVDIPTRAIAVMMPEVGPSLTGDKATNMRFDNRKIKAVVPAFKPGISFADGIKQTLAFLHSNQKARKVDYVWDGRMDRMLLIHSINHPFGFDKKGFKIKNCCDSISLKDRIAYQIGRHNSLYQAAVRLRLC